MIWLWLACSSPEPLVGANLSVTLTGAGGGRCDVVLVPAGEAHAMREPCEGPVFFEGLAPGAYTLWAEGPSASSARLPLTLTEGTAPELTLELVEASSIAVNVLVPATVEIKAGDHRVVRSTEDGWTGADSLPAGPVEVYALARDGAEARHRTWLDPAETRLVKMAPKLDLGRPVLGLRFRTTDAGHVVTWIHELGPAFGLLELSDELLAVNGESLADRDWQDAGKALTGEVGETRRLTVKRDGRTLDVELAAIGYRELKRLEQEEADTGGATGQDIP